LEEFWVDALKECDDERSIENAAYSELVYSEDDAKIDQNDVQTDLWVILCVNSAAEIGVKQPTCDRSDVFATEPNFNWSDYHNNERRLDEWYKGYDTQQNRQNSVKCCKSEDLKQDYSQSKMLEGDENGSW